ncbi:MAG: type II secretion system GspH family protein [Oscillospiraceae bacterium]|nr:type II secretion system GspH family protein [Oscillospiraceae bacterium]
MNKKLKGMTLIEVVIALLIFAIMAATLFIACIFVTNMNDRTKGMGRKINDQAPAAENKDRNRVEVWIETDANGDPIMVDVLDGDGNAIEDPNNPGNNITRPDYLATDDNGQQIHVDNAEDAVAITSAASIKVGGANLPIDIFAVETKDFDEQPGKFRYFETGKYETQPPSGGGEQPPADPDPDAGN